VLQQQQKHSLRVLLVMMIKSAMLRKVAGKVREDLISVRAEAPKREHKTGDRGVMQWRG
jgi:hypothetical protein